jgi:acetyl esterase/lipase
MAYTLDPEVAAALAAMAAQGVKMPVTPRGDWKALRETTDGFLKQLVSVVPPDPSVEIKTFSTQAKDGWELELRWYTVKNGKKGPAVLYAHGGGMVAGSAKLFDTRVAEMVRDSRVPVLSVEYRLAPEGKGTMLAEDTFAGLAWLIANAAKLGADPARIAVMGESAGGGVAAGVAILARDRNIPLARQILIYPMLDDRNTTADPSLAPFAAWTYDNNFTGWSAVLGNDIGTDCVSPIAAPARLKGFAGLAPAYIDVGELDIFRDENLAYAYGLASARVPIEFHLYPGAPHGFEGFAPQSAVARRAIADRLRVLGSL